MIIKNVMLEFKNLITTSMGHDFASHILIMSYKINKAP